MSTQKIPTQFPWIIAGVVAAHGVLAIILFGGGASSPNATEHQAHDHIVKSEANSTALDEVSGESSGAHPLLSRVSERPRFPKRVPLQSELNGEETEAAEPETEKLSPQEFSEAELTSAVAAAKVAPEEVSQPVEKKPASETPETTRLRMVEAPKVIRISQPIKVVETPFEKLRAIPVKVAEPKKVEPKPVSKPSVGPRKFREITPISN